MKLKTREIKKVLKWIFLGTFSFSQLAIAGAPASFGQLKSELQKVSSKDISGWVNGLVKAGAPSRMVGKPGQLGARTWLQNEIKKIDPKNTGALKVIDFDPDLDEAKRMYQSEFNDEVEGKLPASHPDYKKWKGFTDHMVAKANQLKGVKGQNIIWEKSGINSKKMLVITAHYDTISHDKNTLLIKDSEAMPGANYNASGVAVALGLIKVLASVDLNYSVQVVFLDWQGVGFLGSYHHAKALKTSGKDVLVVMNLEMLGQDTSFFDKTKQLGNMKVYYKVAYNEDKVAKRFAELGSKITTKVNFKEMGMGFENSDNFRYSDAGFTAMTFTQNWEEDFNPKFYQTPQDTPETLNLETLYQSYQYLGGAAIGTLLDLTK